MSVTVVVGMQHGDEGKGSLSHKLARQADVVARYQGGANAGHTIVIDGEKTVTHLVPSGILEPGVDCYLCQGMVVDPFALMGEIQKLEDKGVSVEGRLFLSKNAPLVMPWHIDLDEARESGDGALGTTKKGIGPAYESFYARQAILAGDLINEEGKQRAIEKIKQSFPEIRAKIAAAKGEDPKPAWQPPLVSSAVREFEEMYEKCGPLRPHITNVERRLRQDVRDNKDIVLEGAQGTFLSVLGGDYPYVTSSSPTSGGATVGSGLPPSAIDRVIGISKAYATRVGEGPFPTELDEDDPVAQHLRDVGKEYGATTGRPRRCGWLDLDLLKESIAMNGCDEIVLTKLDVLSGLDTVKVQYHGEYREFEGWDEDITDVRSLDDLPEEAQTYVHWLNLEISHLGCRIGEVSVGPGRNESFQL